MTRGGVQALVFGGIAFTFGSALLVVLMAVGGSAEPTDPCVDLVEPGGEAVGDASLSIEQMAVAREAVAAVRNRPETRDLPLAAVIVLATGYQESRLRNLDYGDRDSLGFLQQRPSQGWGTPSQVRNVTYATNQFLDRLVVMPNWQSRRVTDVAADIQRPAEEYRELYQQWVPLATTLVERLWPTATKESLQPTAEPVDCSGGEVVYPVSDPESDRNNWGESGGMWARSHTGTDFSMPCGTPVVAAHTGLVSVDTTQAWAGRWLVKISQGAGKLTTWYAHMQEVTVPDGTVVQPGQQIGVIGTLGNSTGCHLHFEVHLKGGDIYGPDNVDPTTWLRAHVGKSVGSGGDQFTVASFNALGHSHTKPGGNACCRWASAERRTRGLVAYVQSQRRADLLGLQEFQPTQHRVFTALTRSSFDSWGVRDNVVAWRRGVFSPVSFDTLTIPYFGGKPRAMPVVTLQHRSGRVVTIINVHNPASVRGDAQRWRDQAVQRERELVARLANDGRLVLLVGDFNDRADAYCPLTQGGLMTASAGGRNPGSNSLGRNTSGPNSPGPNGQCRPPTPTGIDWIFGTTTTWTSPVTDTKVQGVLSDHPFVSATL